MKWTGRVVTGTAGAIILSDADTAYEDLYAAAYNEN